MLVGSLRRTGLLAARVDTSDPRPLETLTRFDYENVRLGLLHSRQLWTELGRHPGAGVYLPISQHHWALLRESLWAALAGLRGRHPLYLHVFGGRQAWDPANGGGRLTALLLRRMLRSARMVFAETPSVAASLAAVVEPARVRVLPNRVEDPGPASGAAAAEGEAAGAQRILFLSNLRDGKGYKELVAAVGQLGDRLAGWHLRLVGETDERTAAEISEALARLPAGGARAELTGPRFGEQKQDELRAAAIFALPTHYRNEGQPLALVEAMAAGRAIVATRYRGIPDTVTDGVEALLVEPGDAAELARAIERLAADGELRARLGAAARARYEAHHRPATLDAELPPLLRP
jgi:glycosyltransferase involved in cell wall biosynthesis